jgi:hypothetical protein
MAAVGVPGLSALLAWPTDHLSEAADHWETVGEHSMRSGEVAKLTDNLYRALLASIDQAPTSPSPQGKRPTCVTVADTDPI